MCIVEQKTYYQPDGSQQIVDKVRRCNIAIDSNVSLCSNITTHTSSAARIVEVRPETTTSSSIRREEIITGSNRRVYREIGHQSSHKHKTGHSGRSNDRGSIDGHPLRRPPAFETLNTRRPSPGSHPTTPNSAPPRMDSFPPTLPSEHSVRVDRNGTAIYDLPPPLDMQRASENERRPANDSGRKVAFENASTDQTTRQRRPGLSVRVEVRRPTDTIPTQSSPGLSRLPSLPHKRTDSGYGRATRDASPIYPNDQEHAAREYARESALILRQEELEAAENLELDREAERTQHRLFRHSSTTDSSHGSRSRHTSPLSHSRPLQPRTRFASSPPLATNSSHPHRSYGHARIHQYPDVPVRGPSDFARDRGREVIERQRARAAAEDDAAQSWEPLSDDFEDRVGATEHVHVSEGSARQEIRQRRRRDRDDSRRRGERREEFFR